MNLSDWTNYKYGYWRRVGSNIQVCANERIMPSHFVAVREPLFYSPIGSFKYFWVVEVKGWEAKVVWVKE